MGKFTGLNIHGFSTIKGFMEILLAISAHYLIQLKRGADIHKNFCSTPEMCEKCESLAQQIFPIYGIHYFIFEIGTAKLLYMSTKHLTFFTSLLCHNIILMLDLHQY